MSEKRVPHTMMTVVDKGEVVGYSVTGFTENKGTVPMTLAEEGGTLFKSFDYCDGGRSGTVIHGFHETGRTAFEHFQYLVNEADIELTPLTREEFMGMLKYGASMNG